MTRAFATAAVLAMLACGNRQEDLLDERRAACASITPGMTREQAEQILSDFRPFEPFRTCATNLTSLGGDDQCTYAPTQEICIWGYQWLTNDAGLCGPGGGCAYRCDLRIAGRGTTLDTPLCAREFVRGQPFFVPGL